MDFEKALRQLESVVQKLEGGGVSLEEGIELFENGIALSKECFKSLNENKQKIDSIKVEMDKLLSSNLKDEL